MKKNDLFYFLDEPRQYAGNEDTFCTLTNKIKQFQLFLKSRTVSCSENLSKQLLTIIFVSAFVFLSGFHANATNFTWASPSVSLGSTTGCAVTNYTFTQSTTSNNSSRILNTATITITFPAGVNITTATMAGSTFNGQAITASDSWSISGQTISFNVPNASPTIATSTSFTIVIANITNGASVSGNASVTAQNSSGGTNTATYAITTIECVNSFNCGYVYSVHPSTKEIWRYNPASAYSFGTNPTTLGIQAPSGRGVSLGPNVNGGSPSPTLYTVSSTSPALYYWWNGSAWVNTGHNTGSNDPANIGGGPGCLYSIDGNTGQVYNYTGSGNATLICTVPTVDMYDIVVDQGCNFYLLKTSGTQAMLYYNSAGTLLTSWTLAGLPSCTNGAGFAIVNNKVYINNSNGFYEGTISGGVVTFSLIGVPGSWTADFASCPPAVPIALPIELINFQAKLSDKGTVDLTWQTETERNNDYFTIEVSTDGISWKFLTNVDGASNSNSLLNYKTIDPEPSQGTNYYRLIQTDFDGTRSQGLIRIIEIKPNYIFLMSPNPASNVTTIYGKKLDEYQIELYNSLGQKVNVQAHLLSSEEVEINTSEMAAGIYYVVLSSSFSIETLKLIIEK